ncbi:MAG TPA: GNAT family N-acetyltransferase [Pyrinomonadaceae bacterium]|jgi:ribosomal protein S18 acetylase RimI-like enzyme
MTEPTNKLAVVKTPESDNARTLSLRAVVAEDEPFLFEVYASTRNEELAAWGWDAAQQEGFLRMQFLAQGRSYGTDDEQTSHQIILLDERPAGRLVVTRTESYIRLTDIALLGPYRGSGIGTALIKELIEEADAGGLPLRLHVLKTNLGAKRLYERLGFRLSGESGMHLKLERLPRAATEIA